MEGYGEKVKAELMNSKAYIIILNYNGWKDTIECLESIFRSSYLNFQVIVCDNNSTNGSLEMIKKWAHGELSFDSQVERNINPQLYPLVFPNIKKPIKYVEYEYGKFNFGQNQVDEKLILIQNGENLGFSGGNNVGLRYALSRDDFEYIWFLNNDIVVDKEALSALINAAAKEKLEKVGIWGSALCDYKKPDLVQCVGGTLNSFTFKTRPVCRDWYYEDLRKGEYIEFYQGASFLVTKNFIKEIGLFDESYFLYFEEINLSMQARAKGYELSYVVPSVVYHKGGRSTSKLPSVIPDYHFARSRTIFAKRYYPGRLIFLFYKVLEQSLKYVIKGHFKNAKAVVCGVKNGLFYKKMSN
jgi:GT2 family glycosyltransferase